MLRRAVEAKENPAKGRASMTEPKSRNHFAPDSYFAPNIVATQNFLMDEGFLLPRGRKRIGDEHTAVYKTRIGPKGRGV